MGNNVSPKTTKSPSNGVTTLDTILCTQHRRFPPSDPKFKLESEGKNLYERGRGISKVSKMHLSHIGNNGRCVYNFCPGKSPAEAAIAKDVGLGSHTDPQYFTLLWQDLIGGLQVLTREGEWIKATPISGTIVVNIGDFLQGVSNDRFVSTVHRIFSRAQSDRISMPFFFGFNFNEKVGVLESCLGEGEFAKYEPVSCGEWV
ncbi:hypothetical protein BKA61DRAFT_675238 [Leptodontidium sp. MPI-SDFR-AT-0119]|nr:hypothetical protein BKA61DRAFT_675238 [Leptodontidium sp. MPI-SDFR-AT-0119]